MDLQVTSVTMNLMLSVIYALVRAVDLGEGDWVYEESVSRVCFYGAKLLFAYINMTNVLPNMFHSHTSK